MAGGEITFEVDQTALNMLRANLDGIQNGVGKAVAWAANRTASHIATVISTRIRNRIPIKKRDIDPYIKIKRASASDNSPQSTVRLSKSARIGLQYFGARQIGAQRKRTQKILGGAVSFAARSGGVIYTIGEKFAVGAFMGPKPGTLAPKLYGGVFIRSGYPGQREKTPIRKLRGPSPWGVFVLSGAMPETLVDAQLEMGKNVAQAVNYLLLKKAGAI